MKTTLLHSFAGVVFATDPGNSEIFEFTSNGTQTSFRSVLPGVGLPVFNSAGDLFAIMAGLDVNIIEFTNNDGTLNTNPAIIFQGYEPDALAFGANGNLFEADASGDINEFTPTGTVTFASGFTGASALAFDNIGDLFVADQTSNNVVEIAANGSQTTFAGGFESPSGLAFDGADNLYVSSNTNRGDGFGPSSTNGDIYEVTPGGTTSFTPLCRAIRTGSYLTARATCLSPWTAV